MPRRTSASKTPLLDALEMCNSEAWIVGDIARFFEFMNTRAKAEGRGRRCIEPGCGCVVIPNDTAEFDALLADYITMKREAWAEFTRKMIAKSKREMRRMRKKL